MAGNQFIARIGSRESRGQELFFAIVMMAGRARAIKRVPEHESLQAVQCEVLDWATRLGKRRDLVWDYERTRRRQTAGPQPSYPGHP